jgi:ArsR family transcriptional regulator
MARTTDPDVQLLQAAADPLRLRMLRQLAVAGSVCACDFVAEADVSQPTVSHHLRVLRESGWVTTERRGTWIWYSLDPAAAKRFGRLAGFVAPERPTVSNRRLPVVDRTTVEAGA